MATGAPTISSKNISYSIQKIDYSSIPQISSKDSRYIGEDPLLKPFYKYSPEIESFASVFEDKELPQAKRELLVQVLSEQYKKLGTYNSGTKELINSLKKDNVFTVITAHQPSLFTGPLYYVIKIFSTINLANQLNKRYPDKKVIPLFVTGGEDHDFDEVNHLNLFGKTIEWISNESGSVGMMGTKTLKEPLEELYSMLGDSEFGQELKNIFDNSYKKFDRYSDAVLSMVHQLFGKYGLLTLGMNNKKLKGQFAPILKDEILNQSSAPIIRGRIEELEKVNYPNQAHVRDINLFYLIDQIRKRIILEDGIYKVIDTNIKFSKEEILSEIDNSPERFSPNVVLRPLYQEASLPNLAYIGGGGEIAYWLERKSQFEHYGINFPMLIRRNSILWLDKGAKKKMQKFDLDIEKLFNPIDQILKNYVINASTIELNLNSEIKQITEVFSIIEKKTLAIDKGLKNYVSAESAKQIKVLKNIESKLIKAEKQKNEVSVNQIRKVKEKLFPKNNLQERKENFIPIYLKHGSKFFDLLLKELDPLDKQFTIISEE